MASTSHIQSRTSTPSRYYHGRPFIVFTNSSSASHRNQHRCSALSSLIPVIKPSPLSTEQVRQGRHQAQSRDSRRSRRSDVLVSSLNLVSILSLASSCSSCYSSSFTISPLTLSCHSRPLYDHHRCFNFLCSHQPCISFYLSCCFRRNPFYAWLPDQVDHSPPNRYLY